MLFCLGVSFENAVKFLEKQEEISEKVLKNRLENNGKLMIETVKNGLTESLPSL